MIPPTDSHRLRYDPGEGELPVYDGAGRWPFFDPVESGCGGCFDLLAGLLFVGVVFVCLTAFAAAACRLVFLCLVR